MREIALDTETTGLDPNDGHRVVEIGCVEIINQSRLGEEFHVYINPERDMPEEAAAVHGLRMDFLGTQPVFKEIVGDFIDFIGDSPLVIHNAGFDMKFLNAELGLLGLDPLPMQRAIDTVQMARIRFPGAPASLDALCKRFGVDNTVRVKHGALLDAQLLAEVYLHLLGDRQRGLDLARSNGPVVRAPTVSVEIRPPRPHAPSEDELAAHKAFLEGISDPIWNA